MKKTGISGIRFCASVFCEEMAAEQEEACEFGNYEFTHACLQIKNIHLNPLLCRMRIFHIILGGEP